jgi:7,8-dihydro-6-hydroxymethylpterin-pyrophosphokinase
MFDILLNLGSFIIGMGVGKSSIRPREEINMLIQKLNELEEESLLNQAKWLDAEQRAETWSRRYNNLLSTTQTSFEE